MNPQKEKLDAGIVILTFALLAAASAASARTVRFDVTGEGTSSKYEKPVEAERRAVEDALAKASAMAGVDVHYGFADVETKHGSKIYRSASHYLLNWTNAVLEYKIDGKPQYSIMPDGSAKCSVRLSGGAVLKGQADPDYAAVFDDASLAPGGFYRPGQEITISLKPTKNSYVHIITVDEDGAVRIIYPNEYADGRLIKAGETIRIPAAGAPYKLTATLPDGRKDSVEMMHVILTRDAPLFVGTAPCDMPAVSRRLASMNRSRWTMATAAYVIKSKLLK